MQREEPADVAEEVVSSVEATVHAWPEVKEGPTKPLEDGRFVKSFPLEFPMGTGDLRQTCLRRDFTAAEWLQHKLQYYTGHFLSSARGHRFVWAGFNTVLQEHSHSQGNLVHRQTQAHVLTKEELRNLVATRNEGLEGSKNTHAVRTQSCNCEAT